MSCSKPERETPVPTVNGPIIGKWRCEGQVIIMDDGSEQPMLGEPTRPFDIELFSDGRYVDVREGIKGQFEVLDGNHIRFQIIEATRLPKGLSYTNEFTLSDEKLTLSITKNQPGIRRINIIYRR
jgi:hypothetical protein